MMGIHEVFLAEDVTGRFHLSGSVNNQMRHAILVPVE
jgi:hypothetical protein